MFTKYINKLIDKRVKEIILDDKKVLKLIRDVTVEKVLVDNFFKAKLIERLLKDVAIASYAEQHLSDYDDWRIQRDVVDKIAKILAKDLIVNTTQEDVIKKIRQCADEGMFNPFIAQETYDRKLELLAWLQDELFSNTHFIDMFVESINKKQLT